MSTSLEQIVASPKLSVVRDAPDLDAAEAAVGDLFAALGVDMSAPDLAETPRRKVRK